MLHIRGVTKEIRAVLSALPSLAMSVLPIPKGTVAKMDRPRRDMFWEASQSCSGGDCLVSWDTPCRLRSEGRLGLLDLGVQYTCLLLKVVDKLLSGAVNPWTTWVLRWYMAGGSPPPSTPMWKCFSNLVPLLRSLTSVRVGGGENTSLWHEN